MATDLTLRAVELAGATATRARPAGSGRDSKIATSSGAADSTLIVARRELGLSSAVLK